MAERPLPPRFMPAFGMISLVLGHIALALFFMPVLGLPMAACGLLSGLVGMAVALTWRGANWRWSVAGVAVCGLSLAVNAALYWAPEGYMPNPRVPPLWRPPPGRREVPPPAGSVSAAGRRCFASVDW